MVPLWSELMYVKYLYQYTQLASILRAKERICTVLVVLYVKNYFLRIF